MELLLDSLKVEIHSDVLEHEVKSNKKITDYDEVFEEYDD